MSAERTAVGYEIYPQAVRGTIRVAALRIGVPVFVTESGTTADDNSCCIAQVERALAQVRSCLEWGIEVKGYLYWSPPDNFEWTNGYGQHFGLVGVDLETFTRMPKPSARNLGQSARGGAI
jgi:beta-glucosidase